MERKMLFIIHIRSIILVTGSETLYIVSKFQCQIPLWEWQGWSVAVTAAVEPVYRYYKFKLTDRSEAGLINVC